MLEATPLLDVLTLTDQPTDLESHLLSKTMEDSEMDAAETAAAAAFSARQEIDELANSTILSDDRSGMSSHPRCNVGEQKIHEARCLNVLLSEDDPDRLMVSDHGAGNS